MENRTLQRASVLRTPTLVSSTNISAKKSRRRTHVSHATGIDGTDRGAVFLPDGYVAQSDSALESRNLHILKELL